MTAPQRILVFQTAFLGDVVLTLPMVQRLKRHFPASEIDVVTTPAAAPLLRHPDVRSVIVYDKRRTQKGLRGILSMARTLRAMRYDIAVVPHRSLRTAAVVTLSGIPRRITFSTSAGRSLFTDIVPYVPTLHESDRNLTLLAPLGVPEEGKELPRLFPDETDIGTVDAAFGELGIVAGQRCIALAPGSVWNTKRWPAERFARLARMFAADGHAVLIVGGKEDAELGRTLAAEAGDGTVHDLTGRFGLLGSAELIRRCAVLVTNDSAPLHLGVAMRTPVAAIFGATVPAFGFGPYGERDIVVETNGLTCRPCAIHGGRRCPIGTFECMNAIEAARVYRAVKEQLGTA